MRRRLTSGTGVTTVATRGKEIDPNEAVYNRNEQETVMAHYCKRATEIYDSYVNAPHLHRIGADGENVHLTDDEAKATLSETKARVAELYD